MAPPRTWLPRIGDILAFLESSPAERFDRDAVERLFEIQRRQAQVLMTRAGANELGAAYLVDRTKLLAWVREIEATEARGVERRRDILGQISIDMAERRAMRATLGAAGKAPVEFPVCRGMESATMDSLPPEIEVERGRIVVHFDPQAPVEACQLLYALGLALANDYDGFLALMEDPEESSRLAELHARLHASL